MIDLRSDNTLGCSPEIIDALARVAEGPAASYGNDPITERLRSRCRDLFETDVDIIPVATGTAANSLTLAAMSPPWGGVFCHIDAHVHRDELGAPEFFSGGAKLIPISGNASDDGKIDPAALIAAIDEFGSSGRMLVPAALSLTQATEAGTVYATEQIAELCSIAHRSSMLVHVDGARFANAFVNQSRSLSEFTWRSGVDILVFGGTKNGLMAAELLVVFKRELVTELTRRVHRSGHRLSKARFVSAQLDRYFTDDLWIRNARQANESAARLANGLAERSIEILRPVEANIVFARFDAVTASRLAEKHILFYEWPIFGEGAVRLVTGFSTTTNEIDEVLSLIGGPEVSATAAP